MSTPCFFFLTQSPSCSESAQRAHSQKFRSSGLVGSDAGYASATGSLTSIPALRSSFATASCFIRDASNSTRTVRCL